MKKVTRNHYNTLGSREQEKHNKIIERNKSEDKESSCRLSTNVQDKRCSIDKTLA